MKAQTEFNDYNKTPMDVNFEVEPNKVWKDRVKKLATIGTESDMADYYDTEGNNEFYNNRKKLSKERGERNKNEREKGIVGRNNKDHKAKDYSDKSGYVNESNNKPLKRLKFKNIKFLSEAHLLSKVPEKYKVNENVFLMQDNTGTDYIIECKQDPFGVMHLSVESKINKQAINEEINKIKKLYNYSFKDDNIKVNKNNLETMHESINNFRKQLKE